MRFLIINGPNMNLLGLREPEIYGTDTYDDLCKLISSEAERWNDEVEFVQSNHEGILIDAIQEAMGKYDGIVINPAAYSHYSYAIHDALKAVPVPAIEVHISEITTRSEPWRRVSVTAPACVCVIAGAGFLGYVQAMELLRNRVC